MFRFFFFGGGGVCTFALHRIRGRGASLGVSMLELTRGRYLKGKLEIFHISRQKSMLIIASSRPASVLMSKHYLHGVRPHRHKCFVATPLSPKEMVVMMSAGALVLKLRSHVLSLCSQPKRACSGFRCLFCTGMWYDQLIYHLDMTFCWSENT